MPNICLTSFNFEPSFAISGLDPLDPNLRHVHGPKEPIVTLPRRSKSFRSCAHQMGHSCIVRTPEVDSLTGHLSDKSEGHLFKSVSCDFWLNLSVGSWSLGTLQILRLSWKSTGSCGIIAIARRKSCKPSFNKSCPGEAEILGEVSRWLESFATSWAVVYNKVESRNESQHRQSWSRASLFWRKGYCWAKN